MIHGWTTLHRVVFNGNVLIAEALGDSTVSSRRAALNSYDSSELPAFSGT